MNFEGFKSKKIYIKQDITLKGKVLQKNPEITITIIFIFQSNNIIVESIKRKIMDVLQNGEMTQRELREKVGISKSYLSEILKKMEIDGIVYRKMVSKRTVLVGIDRKKFLNVGILKASEYAAVFLASKDMDHTLVNIQIYNNSLEEMKDLLTGKIDIAFAPAITGIIFHLVDREIVMLSACSRGGSGVIYTSRDGEIGSTLLSTMDIITRIFSGGNARIRYFSSPEEIVESYYRGDVQAISIWEPYFTLVNKGEKIMMSREIICCGLITLRRNIDERIMNFLHIFVNDSAQLMEGKRRVEASNLISERLNVDKETIMKSLANYDFNTKVSPEDLSKLTDVIGLKIDKITLYNFLNI